VRASNVQSGAMNIKVIYHLQSCVGNCWPFWRSRMRTSVILCPSPLLPYWLSRSPFVESFSFIDYRRTDVGIVMRGCM
jgi:hypothetical protein